MTRPWEYQPWVEPFQLAVLEIDSARLTKRIETAESAIRARLADIGMRDSRESAALRDALKVLSLLAKHEPWRKAA